MKNTESKILTESQRNLTSGTLNSIETTLNELKNSIQTKEIVVFCGAGISLHSGLPLANDLVRYVLEKLDVTEEEIETIIDSNLPFEAFIETLRNSCNVDRIFDIFDIGEPNTNHFLLAKLAKAKYLKTICTTNFDRLIEKALGREGLVKGDDFQVFYKEDDLSRIDWNDNKIHLIKIHGSVEDKDNMAITLQQVAIEVLSEKRKAVIDHIFSKGSHKNALVLGYSCSDLFDISPQIEAIRENHKKVILLDHNKDKQTVNAIGDKKEKNPFQYFPGSKWVLYNTDYLIKTLWIHYFHEDDYVSPKPTTDNKLWKKCVDNWSSETEEKYTKCAKYNIAGTIFFKISEYESATGYHEQALNIAREIGNKQSEGISLGNLGDVYSRLGDYQKAIAYFEQALIIAREIGSKQIEGACLGNLGKAYRSLGDYQKALVYHKQALSIAREIGDKVNEGACIGDLAIVYKSLGEYQQAKAYFELALIFVRKIGSKQIEGACLGNLGKVYRSLGDSQKAIAFHEQALSIAR